MAAHFSRHSRLCISSCAGAFNPCGHSVGYPHQWWQVRSMKKYTLHVSCHTILNVTGRICCLQNAVRELPPCWHMVGPLVVDRHSTDFPPRFGPEDAAVEEFLQAAAGECLCATHLQSTSPKHSAVLAAH